MTAVLTEERFRAFFKCPAYYALGGQVTLSPQQQIVRTVFEKATYRALTGSTVAKKDLPLWIGKEITRLKRTSSFMDGELMALASGATHILDALWKPLLLQKSEPVLPPREFLARIDNTSIQLRCSAIYQDIQGKGHRYIAYVFSPYKKRLDIANDPVLYLHAQTIAGFVRDALGTNATLVRVIGAHPTKVILEEVRQNTFSPVHEHRLATAAQAIQAGATFPVIPCPDSRCSQQANCLPILNR